MKKGIPITLREQAGTDSEQQLVSINCVTYNHEQFIGDAIESFLSQRTTFPVEILIHDDASTDRTGEIVKQYEEKYPDLIKPIYQTQNQYALGKRPETLNLNRSRGKYIAICDGDDYWTDPLKLHKQVKFLEENPKYSASLSGYRRLEQETGNIEQAINHASGRMQGDGFSFGLDEMKHSWLTKTLTALFRKSSIESVDFTEYRYYRDIHLFYHIIKTGPAFYHNEIFGVYRIHSGGVNSMKQGRVNSNAAYQCYRELYQKNGDEFTRVMFLKAVLGLLNYNLYHRYEENNFRKNCRLYLQAGFAIRRLPELKMMFMVFIKREWKEKALNYF